MPDDKPTAPSSWTDLLIPGDDRRWPSASAALGDEAIAEIFRSALGPGAGTAWREQSPSVEAIAMIEAADPQTFERVIRALYQAYYTSAAVRAVVDTIAAAGPHEPSPYFDDALLRARSERPA
jgi:hypothetical protein